MYVNFCFLSSYIAVGAVRGPIHYEWVMQDPALSLHIFPAYGGVSVLL